MDPRDALLGIVVPALVAGIALLFVARARPGQDAPLASALACGGAYLIAHVWIGGLPRAPWGDAQPTGRDWIAWFALAAIAFAGLREVDAWRRYSTPISIAFFAVVLPRVWLGRTIEAAHPGFAGVALRFSISLALYALWTATERSANRRPGPLLPVAHAIAGAGVALSSLLARSASMAQLAGAATAILGASSIVAFLARGARLQSGSIAVMYVVFFGAVSNVAIYQLPVASALLLGLACAAPWLGQVGPLARWTGFRALCAHSLPTAICAAAAAWIAKASAGPSYGS